MAEVRQKLGQNLKQAREGAGYSQEALSNAIGVWQTVYARYERGEREAPVSALIRISKALKIPLSQLLIGLE